MEILDPIHGSIELSPNEVAVIESPAFQRLRSIKQLGFGEFSFPGSTHNRYLHSLGVSHLTGQVFDNIFLGYHFSRPEYRFRLRQTVVLAAMLHDIGHGPLSHTTEEVMPNLDQLNIKAYEKKKFTLPLNKIRSTHEDYTIKFITDSPLTPVLKEQFKDISPTHIACLIDKNIPAPDDFFIVDGVNFKTVLSQMVSSELDADRMDYLLRDSYFTGTSYGKVEMHWLVQNLTHHRVENTLHMALNRRALYTFDDFLISRHHMYLMVYFHHKSIVYDEMLNNYLTSPDCSYLLPANIDEYLKFTDYHLYEHLRYASNKWARRISETRPLRVLFEHHETKESNRCEKIKMALESEGVEVIHSNSQARLSKYHTSLPEEKHMQIFVVDQYDRLSKPYPIEECTQIFKSYEDARRIERVYVSPEDYLRAEKILLSKKL